MKKLYFVRHGLSKANVENVWGGHNDSPLTAEGRRQAKAAGKSAKEQGLKFDQIIASPLMRAYDTARLIATELGYPEKDITTDPVFLERTFGVLDDTPNADFFETHSYQDIDNVPGAETIELMQLRAHKALEYLKQHDANVILVVGHGAFGRALRRAINDEPYHYEYVNPIERLPNAEIHRWI